MWGDRVAERRKLLGLSQPSLADLCGVSQQTISKIERGEITPLDSLKQVIAARLGTEPWHLFPWPGQAKEKSRAGAA